MGHYASEMLGPDEWPPGNHPHSMYDTIKEAGPNPRLREAVAQADAGQVQPRPANSKETQMSRVAVVVDTKIPPTSTTGEFPEGIPDGRLDREVYVFDGMEEASNWVFHRSSSPTVHYSFHVIRAAQRECEFCYEVDDKVEEAGPYLCHQACLIKAVEEGRRSHGIGTLTEQHDDNR